MTRPRRPQGQRCAVGSVKTNIGHTEGAAGVAGLIKVALSLTHRTIPPSLHFREPNPAIPWHELPLIVQREAASWPVDVVPRLAGVSSFGISGTNAHVVLQEATLTPAVSTDAPTPDEAHLLTISAHDEHALRSLARACCAGIERRPEDDRQPAPSLYDICYTAGLRRTHHDHRLAIVATSREELTERLNDFLQGAAGHGTSIGCRTADRRRRLVFVFPGQGCQWLGMGRQLYRHEPVFREALEQCASAIRQQAGWSLLAELAADPSESGLDRIDIVQPALFAIQIALAALWRSWGIEPDVLVGHSMGEVAAAQVAGALDLDDAVQIICRRSALLKRVSGQGAMAAVELSLDDAREALVAHGCERHLSVAVSNSPTSSVVSGDSAALDRLMAAWQRENVFCQFVKVDVASHSAQVDPLRADLLQALHGLRPRPWTIPIIRPSPGGSPKTFSSMPHTGRAT